MLDLVDDQNHIRRRLVDHLGKRLRECGAADLAELVNLEPERDAHRLHFGLLDQLQFGEQRRGGHLQIGKCLADRGVYQRCRARLRIAPQVNIDHDRATGFERRDQVMHEERRLAGSAHSGEKQARAQRLV